MVESFEIVFYGIFRTGKGFLLVRVIEKGGEMSRDEVFVG